MTINFPRVFLNIKEGLVVKTLDLIDPWLQFSIVEDGYGVVGRCDGHGQNKYDNEENMSGLQCYIVPHVGNTRPPHLM